MNKDFILKVTPCGNVAIKIFLKNCISSINKNQFLKEYKISNYFKGKFFVKRLIKKVFKNHLEYDFLWKKNFWENIVIQKFNIDIDLIRTKNINEFEKKIIKNTLHNRMMDIKKYKKLLIRSIDLGEPLFITANALNYLGARLDSKDIYILDGSRRLVSNILINKKPNILLIDYKKYD